MSLWLSLSAGGQSIAAPSGTLRHQFLGNLNGVVDLETSKLNKVERRHGGPACSPGSLSPDIIDHNRQSKYIASSRTTKAS
jgi:hypothetical protein